MSHRRVLRVQGNDLSFSVGHTRAELAKLVEKLVKKSVQCDGYFFDAGGGAAMTTAAYCAVSAAGRTFIDQLQLAAGTVPHLRVLIDAVHGEGATACAQITHGDVFNFLPKLTARYPRSASGGFNAPGVPVGWLFKKAMTAADLERAAEEFVQGATLETGARPSVVPAAVGRL